MQSKTAIVMPPSSRCHLEEMRPLCVCVRECANSSKRTCLYTSLTPLYLPS